MSLLGSLIHRTRPAPIPEGAGRKVINLGIGLRSEQIPVEFETIKQRALSAILPAIREGHKTVQDIASLTGGHAESVRKVIREMEKRGLVSKTRHKRAQGGFINWYSLPEGHTANEATQ